MARGGEISAYITIGGKEYVIARIQARQGFLWVFNLDCGAGSFQDNYGDGYGCDESAKVSSLINHLRYRRNQIMDCHPSQIPKWKAKEVEYLDKKIMPALKVLNQFAMVSV